MSVRQYGPDPREYRRAIFGRLCRDGRGRVTRTRRGEGSPGSARDRSFPPRCQRGEEIRAIRRRWPLGAGVTGSRATLTVKGSWVGTIAREASGFTPANNLFPDWEKTSSRTEEAERTTGALNAYDRRALMPMRPTTGRAKLRRPMTAVAPDVFDPDSAPGRLPAPPALPMRPKARPAARSPRLRSLLSTSHATIVRHPSPHDPHPRRRRACR